MAFGMKLEASIPIHPNPRGIIIWDWINIPIHIGANTKGHTNGKYWNGPQPICLQWKHHIYYKPPAPDDHDILVIIQDTNTSKIDHT